MKTKGAFVRRQTQDVFLPPVLASSLESCLPCEVDPTILTAGKQMSLILVVDDDDYLLDLIKVILKTHGHTPVALGSARKAFQLCQQKRFDLVITDLTMPDMDGIELIRALGAAKIDVPVLAISGTFNGQLQPVAAQLGAVETLNKPFNLIDLLAAVDRSLGKIPIPPPSKTQQEKEESNKDS